MQKNEPSILSEEKNEQKPVLSAQSIDVNEEATEVTTSAEVEGVKLNALSTSSLPRFRIYSSLLELMALIACFYCAWKVIFTELH